MAMAGALRLHRADRRRRERHRAAAGRGRAGAVGAVGAVGARETTVAAGAGRPSAGSRVLTLGVSVWWIAGLVIEGRYGIDILGYTETYDAVARTSTPAKCSAASATGSSTAATRSDRWVGPAGPYLSSLWLVVVGYARLALALRGARASCAFAIAVTSSALLDGRRRRLGGCLTRRAARRVRPVVQDFVGHDRRAGDAIDAARRAARGPRPRPASGRRCGDGDPAVHGRCPGTPSSRRSACLVLLALDMPPLFTGGEYSAGILREREHPALLGRGGIAALDAGSHDTRVYELPGADFASYRWGGTVDPITPGPDGPALRRPRARAVGLAAGADLLNAFEEQMQDGVFEPSALGPFARLISAGTLSVRNDLQYERYRTPRPKPFWQQILARRWPGPARRRSVRPMPNTADRHAYPLRRRDGAGRPARHARPAGSGRDRVPGAPPIVRTEATAAPARRRRRRRRASSTPARPASSTAGTRPVLPRRCSGRPNSTRRWPTAPTSSSPTTNRRRGAALGQRPGERRLHRAGGRAAAGRRPDRQPPRRVPRRRRRRGHRHRAARRHVGRRPPPTATRSPTRPRTAPPMPWTATRRRRGGSAPSRRSRASGSVTRWPRR